MLALLCACGAGYGAYRFGAMWPGGFWAWVFAIVGFFVGAFLSFFIGDLLLYGLPRRSANATKPK